MLSLFAATQYTASRIHVVLKENSSKTFAKIFPLLSGLKKQARRNKESFGRDNQSVCELLENVLFFRYSKTGNNGIFAWSCSYSAG
jgi:hypothetical protein